MSIIRTSWFYLEIRSVTGVTTIGPESVVWSWRRLGVAFVVSGEHLRRQLQSRPYCLPQLHARVFGTHFVKPRYLPLTAMSSAGPQAFLSSGTARPGDTRSAGDKFHHLSLVKSPVNIVTDQIRFRCRQRPFDRAQGDPDECIRLSGLDF